MKKERITRTLWLPIRVNEAEKATIQQHFSRTTCRSISEYARTVLLKKPVMVKVRNQSADDFLTEMIALKNELNAIGKNLNQAVHKLHTLDKLPAINAWAINHEGLMHELRDKVIKIHDKLQEIYEQWLLK